MGGFRPPYQCALEHDKAMLTDGVLRHPQWIEDAEPMLRRLWEWHAVEELEHEAVAFDACRAAGGRYWRRVLWFSYTSLVFWFDNFCQTVHKSAARRRLVQAVHLGQRGAHVVRAPGGGPA